MITVPAQIFCAPRAEFTAAARSMPGVCGVLLSSLSLLMTLTPSTRQSRFRESVMPGSRARRPHSTGKRFDQYLPVGQTLVELSDANSFIQTVREVFAVQFETPAHAISGYPGVPIHGAVGGIRGLRRHHGDAGIRRLNSLR